MDISQSIGGRSSSFLLARLINLLDYANEDAKHNKDYHIGTEIVGCPVYWWAIYLVVVVRRFSCSFMLILFPHFLDFFELLLDFFRKIRKQFSKNKILIDWAIGVNPKWLTWKFHSSNWTQGNSSPAFSSRTLSTHSFPAVVCFLALYSAVLSKWYSRSMQDSWN